MEYITISERLKIKDKDVAKILNYIERHSDLIKTEELIISDYTFMKGQYDLFIYGEQIDIRSEGTLIISMPTKILANCIAEIYQGLKNINK